MASRHMTTATRTAPLAPPLAPPPHTAAQPIPQASQPHLPCNPQVRGNRAQWHANFKLDEFDHAYYSVRDLCVLQEMLGSGERELRGLLIVGKGHSLADTYQVTSPSVAIRCRSSPSVAARHRHRPSPLVTVRYHVLPCVTMRYRPLPPVTNAWQFAALFTTVTTRYLALPLVTTRHRASSLAPDAHDGTPALPRR